jgi:mannosyltransferase
MTSAAPADTAVPGQAGGQPAPGRWSRLRSRRADVLMLLPAAAELVVGGYKIGSPSLWRDEGDTLSASTSSVHYILALLHHEDAVHAAYYVLMHYVLAVIGTSPTALRLPSLLATAAAASLTAVLGRRLADASGLPVPAITGTAAGLLYVAMPRTTWYAQDARPYAIATLLAVAATYLLVRGFDDGRARWWVAYFVVMVLLAAMNLLALVILVPHALALLAARRPPAPAAAGPLPSPAPASPPAGGAPAGRDTTVPAPPPATGATAPAPPPATGATAPAPPPAIPATASTAPAAAGAGGPAGRGGRLGPLARPWLGFVAASVAAIACLAPLAALSDKQSRQIGWLARPGLPAVYGLIADFGGIKGLVPIVFGLAAVCVVLEAGRWRLPGWTVTKVALPWLLLPPAILIVVSRVHAPVYDERYVLFCMPAIALLAAGGLTGLGGLLAPRVGKARWLAVAAPAALAAVIAVLLIGPQQQIRLNSARPDDLAAVAAFITPRERPGDAVLYVPWDSKVVSQAYPAAFARLRDIAQRKSPLASATLRGTTVSGPVLTRRFASVGRLWLVQLGGGAFRSSRLGRAEHRLLGQLRLAGRWQISTVRLSLYVRP